MKQRQCVTSDEGIRAREQHTKPCGDCPWARSALNGWLGGWSIEEWLREARGESLIECHTLLGAQCAGSAIYRANVGKLPRSRHLLVLPSNKVLVFSTPMEFQRHHSSSPTTTG